MASKTTGGTDTVETRDEVVEGVLLDTMTAAVKRLIARGKERGYVTYDELNAILPPDQVSSEQIEDTMADLSEIGIKVVESEESRGRRGPRPPSRRPTRRKRRTRRSRAATSTRRASAAPTTRSACTCARWAASSCCRARARSPSPSGSRPAAT